MKHVRELYAAGGKPQERADCVVRAISLAGNLDYDHVHAVLAKHGRKPRRATYRSTSFPALKELFNARPQYIIGRRTLAQFVSQHRTGRFVVFVRGHALAVIDGIVHDWSSKPRRLVKVFWEVSK